MRVGVDLGGTKIEAIALDRAGAEIARQRVPTPQGDYEGTVRAVAALVADVEKNASRMLAFSRKPEEFAPRRGANKAAARAFGSPAGRATVGVGMPGVISRAAGVVKNSNSVCLIGKPFDRDLERELGRPVRVANDANCFALSEASDGAGEGCEVVFGAILGTGTGGGIVVRGQVLGGVNGIAGEWGHNPLPWPDPSLGEAPGPACYCGRRGCIETFLSGPGIARDHAVACGARLDAMAIAGRARAGDASCEATLARYEARLARALAMIINVIDPDVIVLGGGVSNLERLYESVPRLWSAHVFSDRVDTRLLRARHGDSSGVRGAAWLWPVR